MYCLFWLWLYSQFSLSVFLRFHFAVICIIVSVHGYSLIYILFLEFPFMAASPVFFISISCLMSSCSCFICFYVFLSFVLLYLVLFVLSLISFSCVTFLFPLLADCLCICAYLNHRFLSVRCCDVCLPSLCTQPVCPKLLPSGLQVLLLS